MKEVIVGGLKVRRRSYWRFWLLGIVVFVAVGLFTFLAQVDKSDDNVEAASLANFDPGYIISDYQMGNYTSMTEAEIQAFLTSKVSCDRGQDYYNYLKSAYSGYDWHFKDGHIVCLPEELFGDGETIGSGQTAAHIIWQAAQDFRINPQVLIVLLQKEQGLITDTYPNTRQYRSATGYGCPDTAPCSTEYYGFKNQVRKAAELFRLVLDGQSRYYPIGENYIQYNPSYDCGGSVVNIKNYATSALYRYTPYQPNAGALAAGYGTAECGAYGNRNFYLYFEDWFSGIRDEFNDEWSDMLYPRIMMVNQETMRINPVEKTVYNGEKAGLWKKYYFTTKIDLIWGGKRETCLRTATDTEDNIDRCIIMSRMVDVGEDLYVIDEIAPIVLEVVNDTQKYNLKTGRAVQEIKREEHASISFSAKTVHENKTYYQTTYDLNNHNEYFIPEEDLYVLKFEKFLYPRNMTAVKDANFVNLKTGDICRSVKAGYTKYFATKVQKDGKYYYRVNDDEDDCVILSSYVGEAEQWNGVAVSETQFEDFMYPRNMVFRQGVYSINITDGTSCDRFYAENEKAMFTTKVRIGRNYYYRTEEETEAGLSCVLKSSKLMEV